MISIFEMRDDWCRGEAKNDRQDHGARIRQVAHEARIYGLMAEFDESERARRGGAPGARGGLPQDGRLLAVPDRGARRGARTSHAPRLPLIVLIGGHRRRPRRVRPAVLGLGRSTIR